MLRSVFVALLVTVCSWGYAQEYKGSLNDSIYVAEHKNTWHIKHSVRSGETIFMLARRYHVPPAMLADANGMNYQQGLEEGQVVWVPLGAYNRKKTLPSNPAETRVLYYKAKQYDNMFMIARFADLRQKTIQSWNKMSDNKIESGRVLKVGWVLYDATQLPFVNNAKEQDGGIVVETGGEQEIGQTSETNKYANADTVIRIKKKEGPSKEEKLYMSQTHNEAFVMGEKGTAVFFDMPGKSKGTFYAFHNSAPRGTIIKVVNPGTKMFAYVKVLGALPNTGQYHNSIIGIASNAKKALGVSEEKLWCELYYYPDR